MKKHNSSTRASVMKKTFSVFFAFLSIFMLLPLSPSIVAEAVYNADYTVIMSVSGTSKALTKNKLYYSPNKTYACVFQSDGNLVVYRHRPWLWGDQVTRENAIWKSGTNGIAQNGNCYLQKDANLVVYAANGAWKFSTYFSNSNAKKVELRLDNNGVLRVYYKTSTLGNWNLSWQSCSSPMGTQLKNEPDASLFVGKWVKSSWPQSENTSITIEFCEDGRLKATCHDVHDMAWGWIPGDVFCYLNSYEFQENVSSSLLTDHRIKIHYDPIANSELNGEIESDDDSTSKNFLYIDDEGDDLFLGNNPWQHFKRYEYPY